VQLVRGRGIATTEVTALGDVAIDASIGTS